MQADQQLSMLPNHVIDQLLPKINKRVVVDCRSSRPSDETAYNEKLSYLRSVASSLGKPVCRDLIQNDTMARETLFLIFYGRITYSVVIKDFI